ncbi:MAG: hypothetical protein HQL90_02920 [Magnetococcales bacterium]|nr:hypothetical protein [Magnetococcales bacterium]
MKMLAFFGKKKAALVGGFFGERAFKNLNGGGSDTQNGKFSTTLLHRNKRTV